MNAYERRDIESLFDMSSHTILTETVSGAACPLQNHLHACSVDARQSEACCVGSSRSTSQTMPLIRETAFKTYERMHEVLNAVSLMSGPRYVLSL